jgi:hypothetical protein
LKSIQQWWGYAPLPKVRVSCLTRYLILKTLQKILENNFYKTDFQISQKIFKILK